jgi:hypothetical protein
MFSSGSRRCGPAVSPQPAGDEQVHPLAEDARRGEELAKLLQPARRVTRLLLQLARRRHLDGFRRLQGARGDLPEGLANVGPHVAQQADVVVGDERQDGDRAGVQDDIAADDLAAVVELLVDGDLDLAADVNDGACHGGGSRGVV